MSQLQYDQQQSAGTGLDWPRALAFVLGVAILTPALALGAAGVYVWRFFGWRWPWAAPLLVLSFVPLGVAVHSWDASPFEVFAAFAEIQLAAVFSVFLWLFGRRDLIPHELTPLNYLRAMALAVPPLAVLSGFVVARMTGPRKSQLQYREATPVDVPRHVERRASGGVKHPRQGWALGYATDGKAVAIADAESRQHAIVCGSTGSGKTTVLRHVLAGVAGRCPIVVLDCKASPALRRAVEALPGSVVWTIGGKTRWDALRGDPTCFASKMLAAEQFGPNAAIYRAAAERYVQWVGRLLEATDQPRDPRRVAELLAPKAFAAALRELRDEADPAWWQEEGEPIARRLTEMGKAGEEGVAGFAARFGVVVEGVAARGLGTGRDGFALEDLVAGGRTVLFSLDAAAYPTLAAKLGAWVLLDLVRVAGLLQEADDLDRARLYVVVDEFSALGAEGRHVVPLLARAREAGVAVVLATQGLADLERVDRALPTQIVQNTAVRVVMRQQSHEDALGWARHLGELEREDVSRRLEWSGGLFGGGERDTGQYTTRWRRDFYVRPEELQALGTGEAVVHVAPVVERRRRLERVRVARPAGGPGAAAAATERVEFRLGPVKIAHRSRR